MDKNIISQWSKNFQAFILDHHPELVFMLLCTKSFTEDFKGKPVIGLLDLDEIAPDQTRREKAKEVFDAYIKDHPL